MRLFSFAGDTRDDHREVAEKKRGERTGFH